MKTFEISEEQVNSVLLVLGEVAAKFSFDSVSLLKSLKEIEPKVKEKKSK